MAYARPRVARWGATLVAALIAALTLGSVPASAQEDEGNILLYTGTTGYRHASAIEPGTPIIKTALETAGYTVTVLDCDGLGGGAENCDGPEKNPSTFTDEGLEGYDAMLLFNASSSWAGGDRPGPLWTAEQRAAIIRWVQAGGGIAANHNAVDMGAGVESWDWWDGGEDSAVGTLMTGHAASDLENVAEVEVADRHHLSTADLPDSYEMGDEHYNFERSVRGTHHVLSTLDESTYEPGDNGMGQDHPISWCKLYDGEAVEDGTGTPKAYDDGRVWTSGMGHFGESYEENGGDNELVKHIVGGVRWVAGAGDKTDCSGTVWSNFKRTILVDDVNGPIGVDVAADGKVFWSEIGPEQGYESEGFIKMHDPEAEPNNQTTVATIPTRADHGNSEDGVLGMSLEPGFDLADPEKRDVFVYYSPRNPDWPTTGDQIVVGHNQVSRFTLNEAGTQVVEGSERVILEVPKAKISGDPAGFEGGPTDNGPGHVGGAGLDFDSEGNLYLGVGDDVSPNADGHGRYTPMDYRAAERWDARKTAANSADLRGKVLRIAPLDEIPADAEPGVDATYAIPEGNMFAPGTEKTRPEIYAMGFRQPFTVHTDAANPGNVVVGEYCHDNSANQADRAPAGVCEWNLVDEPSFQGWPFCMGDNAAINTTTRWNYAGEGSSTGQKYDCSLDELPSDLEWAPEGQTAAPPTFDGLATLPGPATPATVWRKYPGTEGAQDPLAFGDLNAGGMSPITGPVYRYDEENADSSAFPAYYDGSWFIANRGDDNGFWKEVRLRSDNAEMLRVNDWVPSGGFGAPANSYVIPTQFGPDGALYMARWTEGCCRNQLDGSTQTQLVKIEFAPAGECTDTEAPTVSHEIEGEESGTPGTYVGPAKVGLTAVDAGCAGVGQTEYRIGSSGDWQPYAEPVEFENGGTYTVQYRATDRKGNASEVGSVTFTVDAEGGEIRDVVGSGTTWEPSDLIIGYGETVTWSFDPEDSQPHDVWLVPPGGDPTADIFQITPGPVPPGGAPVSYAFDQAGGWAFVCRIHSTQGDDGTWTGMVGTVTVGDDTGNPDPPDQPDPPGSPPPTPPAQNPPAPPSPPGSPDEPDSESRQADVKKLARTTLRQFRRRGLKVRSACESGQSGRVRITAGRRQARKLGYRKAKTLVSKRVRCGRGDRLTVRVKPSRQLKRKLLRARRSVAVRVEVRMGSGRSATKDSRRLVLRAPKRG